MLSLLLIAVVVNSLLHGGGESPFNPNPVAAAAERTQEVPGMRMTLTMGVSTPGAPETTITGSGVFNGEENLADFSYHLTGPQGTPLEFEGVMGEEAWYFRYPQAAEKLPEGKEWVKVQGIPGQNDLSQVGESPQSSLQILAGAGSVEPLGHVRVRGVTTTRYRVVLTAEGVVSALRAEGKDELADAVEKIAPQLAGPIQDEVFIDRHDMMRRLNSVTTMAIDGKTVTTKVHMDLFDFGIHPTIAVPSDSQVLDLGPMMEEQLQALGQSS